MGIKVYLKYSKDLMFNQCSKIDNSVIKHCNINIITHYYTDLIAEGLFYSHTGRCHPQEAPHWCQQRDDAQCGKWPVISCWGLGCINSRVDFSLLPLLPLSLLTRHSWVQSLQRIIRRRNRLQLASRSFCPSPPLLLPVHQLTLEIICIRNAWPSVVILPRYIVWDNGE